MKRTRTDILLEAKERLLQQALDDNRYLEAALQRIINPIKFMAEDAKRDGMLLDGPMAVTLSSDPAFLKQIAKEALARLTPVVPPPTEKEKP